MSTGSDTGLRLRDACEDDRAAIIAIYNHYVRTSHVTFDTQVFEVAGRAQWFDQFDDDGRHRLIVAEREGTVCGYAASTPLRARPAYGRSVETTVYVDAGFIGQGIGRRLCKALLSQLPGAGVHRVYSAIALPNPASVALHEGCGFRHVGTFDEVGFKFERYWDVAWYELRL